MQIFTFIAEPGDEWMSFGCFSNAQQTAPVRERNLLFFIAQTTAKTVKMSVVVESCGMFIVVIKTLLYATVAVTSCRVAKQTKNIQWFRCMRQEEKMFSVLNKTSLNKSLS
ncbi:CLUMA_CG004647, isoform A [Clunio marinus]|uniref:CLUMA_CG004647, isoform A n=1 Tax=Clunio marinus TaxID=568069 RepID=A0A1J1HWQ2_9DIPT|nr:CLUMA_CG004647, isoform A [Clunio marinus]